MLLHGLRERAEDHAGIGQFFLERCGDRDAVEYGINGDAGQSGAFVQRNAELVVGFQQLRIDLVEALGPVFVRLGRRRNTRSRRNRSSGNAHEPSPARPSQPLPVGLQAPFEHELGLVLACRYGTHDIFVEAGRQALGFDIGDKAVFVAAIDQALRGFRIRSTCIQFFFDVDGQAGEPKSRHRAVGASRSTEADVVERVRIATLIRCHALPTLQTASMSQWLSWRCTR